MRTRKTILLLLSFFCAVNVHSQEAVAKDTTEDSDKIFSQVEVEASYPGGTKEWSKYLSKSLKNFTPADQGSPTGKYEVRVKFVVDKDGQTSDIHAITKLGFGMEEEVVKVIKNSGKWTPAVQHGKLIRAYRIQPVTFIVDDDDYKINTKVPYTLFTNTDNEVSVELSDKKYEGLQLNLSEGTAVANGDGKFTIRVNKTGRVTVELLNKKNKAIGSMSLEVKNPAAVK